MRLTLAIVGKTLFGADVEGDASDVGEAVTTILGMFDETLLFLLLFASGRYVDRIRRLPMPAARRFNDARARLDAVIYRLIDEAKRAGADGTDLLSRLLQAGDAGSGMTDEQVRDEAMTLFLAGHETTVV